MEEENEFKYNLKAIVRTSLFGVFTIIIAKLLIYIYRVIIARHFGPETYGLFSLAVMVSGIFTVIASFGLFEGLVRYISFYRGKKKEENIKYLISWSTKFLAISGIVLGIIMFLLSETISINIFHNNDLIFMLKMFSIIVPISVFVDLSLAILRGYELINWYSFISTLARNAVKVILITFFIFIGLQVNAISLSYILGTLAILLFTYLIYKKKIVTMNKKNIPKTNKLKLKDDLLNYSFPLIFSTVIFMIFGWIDSFAIGYFKGAYEVGLYNAAIPIAMIMAIAPDLFMRLFFPMITREYSKNNLSTIKELSKQVSKWIFIINLPILILLIIFPGAALNILFGKEYLVAENALRILALAFFISTGIGTISLRLISMTGKSKIILYNNILALILNLFLIFILVPINKIWIFDNSNGLVGASLATLISLVFMVILFAVQSYRLTKVIPLRRTMTKIAISSIIPTSILLLFRSMLKINILTFIILFIIYFVIYLTIIIVLKGLDRNDILIIKSLKNRIFKERDNL